MAWLGADALPMVHGWSPEPQLHAADISGVVSAALRNRQVQQELQQRQISEAIKQYQEQRQAGVYGQALQNAGLVPPGVDVSGMSSADLSKLSQAIQEQTPDTDLDALHRAMANYYSSGGRAAATGALGKEWVQDANGQWHYVTGNAALRTAQGGGGNPYADRFKEFTTPGVVTYWTPDYSRQLSTQEAEADPDTTVAVLPDKTAMPYSNYKKVAGTVVNKYYTTKGNVSQNDTDQAAQAQGLSPGPSAPPAQPNPPYDQSIPPDPGASPTPPPAGAASGANNVLQERADAYDAIKNGADPQAVRQRFHDRTGGDL